MMSVWVQLSSRPRARQCAVIVCAVVFGILCGWLGSLGQGIPMSGRDGPDSYSLGPLFSKVSYAYECGEIVRSSEKRRIKNVKQQGKQCPICKRMLKAPGLSPHMAWHRKHGQTAPVSATEHPIKSHLELAIQDCEARIVAAEALLQGQREIEQRLVSLRHEREALKQAKKDIEQFGQPELAHIAS